MSSTTYVPVNGELLDGAPYNNTSVVFAGGLLCGCSHPTNQTTPLPIKTATITGFTGTTLLNVRRFAFQVNGQSYTKEINVSLAFSTFANDKPALENELVNGELGIARSLVGGGANVSITASGGNLVIAIQSVADFAPQNIVVGGTAYAFA